MLELNQMNQQQIDQHAERIVENMNIDEVIFETTQSYFSGSNFDDECDDAQHIASAVRYALINNLKGRF